MQGAGQAAACHRRQPGLSPERRSAGPADPASRAGAGGSHRTPQSMPSATPGPPGQLTVCNTCSRACSLCPHLSRPRPAWQDHNPCPQAGKQQCKLCCAGTKRQRRTISQYFNTQPPTASTRPGSGDTEGTSPTTSAHLAAAAATGAKPQQEQAPDRQTGGTSPEASGAPSPGSSAPDLALLVEKQRLQLEALQAALERQRYTAWALGSGCRAAGCWGRTCGVAGDVPMDLRRGRGLHSVAGGCVAPAVSVYLVHIYKGFWCPGYASRGHQEHPAKAAGGLAYIMCMIWSSSHTAALYLLKGFGWSAHPPAELSIPL